MPRVVLFHLADASVAGVEKLLVGAGFWPPGALPDDFWRYPSVEATVLYVSVRDDDHQELRRIDGNTAYDAIRRASQGRVPNVLVFVEVSNHFNGLDEIRWLARALLRGFPGCAQDEYSEHFWSLHEIERRRRFDGHGFFDSLSGPRGGRERRDA